jgi:hypothetical protein
VASVLRDGLSILVILAVTFCLLMNPAYAEASAQAPAAASGQSNAAIAAYPNTSWALGVVVPEGAGLQDGGKLRWEGVSNVTAAVTLPNITLPDRITYVVLSVMTSDGSVLQAAAGVYPNRSSWLAYSWFVPNINTVHLTYQWVLNASEPQMAQDSRIAITIYQASGLWKLRVVNLDTGASIDRSFPSGSASSIMVGDQEVFALESYSRSEATFQDMGNLTLSSLLVDGQKVTGGLYSYGNWDPSHNPVFIVGSSGTTPPTFLHLQQLEGGAIVWGFSSVWEGNLDGNLGGVWLGIVGLLVIAGLVVAALVNRAKGRTA